MLVRRCLPLVVLLATAVLFSGCEMSSSTSNKTEKEDAFVLGDLVEPFEPPTLDDLNSRVEWVNQPLKDSIELLRQRQAKEKPLVAVKEALAMRNTTEETNKKILSVLGRLPKNDAEVNWDASIVRHAGGDVKSTKPHFASSTTEFDVISLIGFGIISFDWNMSPFAVKETVKSWQTSKDHLYDKIVLRDDLTWSDGKPITAHDLEFSFKVTMSSKVPITSRTAAEKLKWVKAYDDHTVVFFHKEALATNVWNISLDVLPKHIYEKSIYNDPTLQNSSYHVEQENHPISGSAYVLTERVRGEYVTLVSRKSWYMHEGKQVRDKPYFKKIRFQVIPDSNTALLALKSGDLDESEINPEQWKTQTGGDDFYKLNTKAYGNEWTSFHFCWNCKSPYFSDIRVRKAMSYAFDHEEMLKNLRYGLNEPCNGIFHFTSQWAAKGPEAPKPYKRDINKAEALLDEAGWIDHDGDGIRDKSIRGRFKPFEFEMLVSPRPDRLAICNLLKENMSDIGIICNVRTTEFTVMQDRSRKHKFDATMGGWGTGADPFTLENIFGTEKMRNYGQYSNKEVDKLFTEGVRELDAAKRRKVYGKIHRLLYDDQPYTWLYFRSSFYGFNKQLRGYVFSPRGPYTYSPGFGSIWKPVMK